MQVFISYSSEDSPFVDRLCKELEVRGVSIWRDVKDIKVGDSIIGSIEKGIIHCDHFCLVLSSSSISRSWVKREYRTALHRQLSTDGHAIRILPIRVDNCSVPELLKDIKYADFSNSFIKGIDSLLTAMGIDPKRKVPYFELNSYVGTHYGSFALLIQKLKERTLSHEEVLNIMLLIWKEIKVSMDELGDYIKWGLIVEYDSSNPKEIPDEVVGTIISPPLYFYGGYVNIAFVDDVEPYITINGIEEFLNHLNNNIKLIMGRRLFLIPEECEYEWDSYPNGWGRDEINLADTINSIRKINRKGFDKESL